MNASADKNLPSIRPERDNQVDLSLAWESIFGGSTAAPPEGARANSVGDRMGAHEAVVSTLVSDVPQPTSSFVRLDLELEIRGGTLASRQDSLRLTQTLANGGATSMLDVPASGTVGDTAAENYPRPGAAHRAAGKLPHYSSGKQPWPIARGTKLTDQPHVPEIPAGLPQACSNATRHSRGRSTVNRGHAQIGVAKAAIPSIS